MISLFRTSSSVYTPSVHISEAEAPVVSKTAQERDNEGAYSEHQVRGAPESRQ